MWVSQLQLLGFHCIIFPSWRTQLRGTTTEKLSRPISNRKIVTANRARFQNPPSTPNHRNLLNIEGNITLHQKQRSQSLMMKKNVKNSTEKIAGHHVSQSLPHYTKAHHAPVLTLTQTLYTHAISHRETARVCGLLLDCEDSWRSLRHWGNHPNENKRVCSLSQ